MVSEDQLQTAKEVIEAYILEQQKKISELKLLDKRLSIYKNPPIGIEDIDGLTVVAYNKLKVFFQKNFRGMPENEVWHKLSKSKLIAMNGIGKKTLNNIEESFDVYGIKLLP